MLDRLFPFLDIVVLEQDSSGVLHALYPFPSWLLSYYAENRPRDASVFLDWPFFSDFLTRASEFWNQGQEGHIGSGPWSETDVTGNDRILHATAMLVSDRRILLIEPAKVPVEEAQALLQKGRQKSLDFRTVKRKQRSLRKVQQRYLTLLDAVPDWVLIIHQDGTILEYSTGRDELFEDIQLEAGQNVFHVLPGDLAEQLRPQLENVISSGRPQLWKYRRNPKSIEILMLATGEDEALCILRPR